MCADMATAAKTHSTAILAFHRNVSMIYYLSNGNWAARAFTRESGRPFIEVATPGRWSIY
jgi:hypothetical protein